MTKLNLTFQYCKIFYQPRMTRDNCEGKWDQFTLQMGRTTTDVQIIVGVKPTLR